MGSHPLPTRSVACCKPTLTVSVGVEDIPRVAVIAASFEDERRVRLWLSQPGVLRRFLDDLERIVERLQIFEVEEDV